MARKELMSPDLKKADDLHKKAKGQAAKTLFHSPEWDAAAATYREALKAYQKADIKSGQILIDCLRESATAHKNANSLHTAAQDLQKAAELQSKDQKDEKLMKEAVGMFKESGNIFRANGSLDKGADMYIEAAKRCDTKNNMDEAVSCLNEAIKVFEEEVGKNQMGEKIFDKCIGFCVENQRWDNALEFMKRKNLMYQEHLDTFEQYLYKTYLGMMMIYFLREDYKKAAEDLQEWEKVANFQKSEYWTLCAQMLAAYDEGNAEDLKKTMEHSHFKYLTPQLARLAKKVAFRDDVVQSQKQNKDGIDKKDAAEVDLT